MSDEEINIPPLPHKPNGDFAPDVRGKTLVAVNLMCEEGISDKLAAQRANIRIDNLRRALKRPAVKAYMKQEFERIRENQGRKAYLRLIHLSETTESDSVKASVDKWIAGVDGISPVAKHAGTIQHTHSFGGFTFGRSHTADQAIDVTPPDHKSVCDDD